MTELNWKLHARNLVLLLTRLNHFAGKSQRPSLPNHTEREDRGRSDAGAPRPDQGNLQRGGRGPRQVVHAVGRDRATILGRLQELRKADGSEAVPSQRGQVR